ncbi:L-ascorbate metabolism protein UlaG (beta-lactamase superfamily) [Thermocatellispora tengchongensis]|uniref:L-ascorbate metabolism protein UlaG (Beta-lactamase superfamily) n=1 Tax=Thermocatellispora tengchongensis TaxID=1073253 RepID=A0A840PMK9_9ACTN|nr:MBL fold metallo-hydrolase [Thermocatellispora tengchongensis]MBB5137285.1 L-ascorbate metabolism protein UlaG (beta-lactamase superfamily) [Thermocatellispora tengchongensis]
MSTSEHTPEHVPVPMTPRRLPFGVAVLGGPTTVIDLAGFRLICDPTFDSPTDYGYLRKLAGPAADEAAVGEVDVALVSHDLHPDNLDHAGRAFALRAPVVLAPATAAQRLGAPARPLDPWATWTSDDGRLRVTGVPARHGPADGELNEEGFVNCEVIGFVISVDRHPTVYVSGDNASLGIVYEIRERVGTIDCAVLFAGSASVPAKFGGRPLSLTAERAAAAAEVLGSSHVVVAHQDGWAHFTQGSEDTRSAFAAAGIADRLCTAPLGHWCTASPTPGH